MLLTYSFKCVILGITNKERVLLMNTKNIRSVLAYTQDEFARKYDIAIATVKNWDARNCMPEYLYRLICKDILVKKYLLFNSYTSGWVLDNFEESQKYGRLYESMVLSIACRLDIDSSVYLKWFEELREIYD